MDREKLEKAIKGVEKHEFNLDDYLVHPKYLDVALQTLVILAQEYLKIEEPQNPYPKDIFTSIDNETWDKIHKCLLFNLNIPLDRISGNLMGKGWDLCCNDFRLYNMKRLERAEEVIEDRIGVAYRIEVINDLAHAIKKLWEVEE